MLITNVTREVLDMALAEANRWFEGNLRFREIERTHGLTREGGEKWKVLLGVRSRAERERCGECEEKREHPNHYTKARCRERCAMYAEIPARKFVEGQPFMPATHKDPSVRHHRYRRGQSTAGVVRKVNRWKGGEKYIAVACWHAHGVLFDALPEIFDGRPVWIYSGPGMTREYGRKGEKRNRKWSPSDEWRTNPERDWSVGSMMYPVMMSEQCDCAGGGYYVPRREEVAVQYSIPDQVTRRIIESPRMEGS